MKISLQKEISRAIDSYPQLSFKRWCLCWPGQVVLATSNIYWTAEVTQANRFSLLLCNAFNIFLCLYILKFLNNANLNIKLLHLCGYCYSVTFTIF